MAQKFEVSIEVVRMYVKLRINSTIHAIFKQADFVAIDTYRPDKSWYCIDITLKEGIKITLDYDSKEKWEEILKTLDSIL